MLNFEISGNGKENLVLLHGFMENLSIWEEMEQSISEHFTLIKIDLMVAAFVKVTKIFS